jgi:hypothetical protein
MLRLFVLCDLFLLLADAGNEVDKGDHSGTVLWFGIWPGLVFSLSSSSSSSSSCPGALFIGEGLGLGSPVTYLLQLNGRFLPGDTGSLGSSHWGKGWEGGGYGSI